MRFARDSRAHRHSHTDSGVWLDGQRRRPPAFPSSLFSLAGLPDAIPVFTLKGMRISFFAMLIAITLCIVVSLPTCRRDYPINQMLHRDELPVDATGKPVVEKRPWSFARLWSASTAISRAATSGSPAVCLFGASAGSA